MKKTVTSLTFFLVILTTASAFGGIKRPFKKDDTFFMQRTGSREIRLMSLNAHNLYDTKHDDGYFDYTYLPLSHPDKLEECATIKSDYYRNLCTHLDWTPKRLNKKLKQIQKILRQHGSVPDILALQEVENENVVKMLANRMGYSHYTVTDQKSKRGQDVALLWNERKLDFIDQSVCSEVKIPRFTGKIEWYQGPSSVSLPKQITMRR